MKHCARIKDVYHHTQLKENRKTKQNPKNSFSFNEGLYTTHEPCFHLSGAAVELAIPNHIFLKKKKNCVLIPLILNTTSLIVHLKPKSMAMQCGHSLHVRLLEKEDLSFLLQ